MGGWIKLYRELLDNPIWKCSTNEQKVILITLMLMANHESNKWEWRGKKFEVQAGQFVTSLQSIAEAAGGGITIQNVRTALNRFEKLEFLTNKSTKTGRLITIVNWRKYQDRDTLPNKDTNKDLTKTQQRPNKDLTTNKNDNNDNNDNKMMIDTFTQKYTELTGKQISTTSINNLSSIDGSILEKVIDEIKQSTYLKNNADISWIISNLNKIVEGKYRDYTKTETVRNQNSFHNFKQLSDNYDENYFEELARKKREEFRRQLEMEEQGVNG